MRDGSFLDSCLFDFWTIVNRRAWDALAICRRRGTKLEACQFLAPRHKMERGRISTEPPEASPLAPAPLVERGCHEGPQVGASPFALSINGEGMISREPPEASPLAPLHWWRGETGG